ALRAFSSASEMNFDEMIKEDALFNYAKLTYELSYSPFNEAIKAFDKYISLYPNTERNATAYDFLVQVYMTTRNYKEALSSIEKIRNKTASIKKAYQRLTYYRGLELFSNQDFKEAQGMFKKSLADGQYDANLKANALFWSGETYFRLEDFRAAVSEYKAFLNSQGVAANPEFYRANYGIGYAYFKQKDYELALPWFKKVVNSEAGGDVKLYSDALNRLGDCYFSGRNFTMAMEAYAKSQKIGDYDPDYALFQLAFCNGMLRKDDQKIDQLNLLLKKYPGTSLGADALFEIGRTYEKIGQNNKALDSYQELIRKYPSSSLVSKALLQSGLTSYNLNDYKKSLGYYKQVVEKYPQSQDVQSALYGMKNSYVELNQVDEYVDYSNKIGGNAAVSKGEQDSLMYVAAEKLFMAGDSRSKKQLEKYLSAFPTGGSALNAHFYLAEIYYKDKEFPKALADYEFVTAASANSFSEAALAKAGELRYNTGDYKDALSHFLNLEKIGGSKLSLLTARQGIMSCYYSLNDYPAVIESADKLLKTENLNETVGAEARFMKGKALYQTKRPDLAFPLLKEAAKNTQTAEGAEAKYLTTQILFDQKKLQQSEKEIMDFINKGTSHQYWLARSFILLSEIYQSKGELFQAKETLRSLMDNYTVKDDGIMEEAEKRFNVIDNAEKAIEEKGNNSYEINLKKSKAIKK
ncbi:MAG: tetratricopeptide repeat protein, partial [Bacteroidota bacterium]|nr:tetratricopeptide repeat protein [Bacteroidota bacterium]